MGERKDTEQLSPLEIVEMFEWNDTVIGGSTVFRWHPGTTPAGSLPIVWQGVAYEPFPIEAEGFEMQSGGKLPRPMLRASNIGGLLGNYVRAMRDALGARVTRKRTLGKYLDEVNFPGGNPNADPDAAFPDEIYYVSRKATENPIVIEMELAVPFDVEGVQLPRRQVIAGTCQWVYRDPTTCGYTGPAVLNDPVFPGQDKCGKTLTSCKLRFGANGMLRTSAFPASAGTRYS